MESGAVELLEAVKKRTEEPVSLKTAADPRQGRWADTNPEPLDDSKQSVMLLAAPSSR